MPIEISRLYKSFGDVLVFADFSCAFPEGEISCIAGPSGSGKTTLLRLLMGLEQPDSGYIAGMDGKRLSAAFQEDRLCENLSALSNVYMVCKERCSREDLQIAMAALGLAGHENRPVRELSGGMRRRVALLRALSADYDILFLDEAFKGLDEDNKAAAIAYTLTASQGKTVIMVAHDDAEAAAMGASILRLNT